MMPNEVFLSHAVADKDFTMRLVNVLRTHGVPVWYSATEIRGAQQWQEEIGAALRRCDWFVVVVSPNALRSFWVKRELAYALAQPRFVNRITPILLAPCDMEQLSWTLSAIQYVDFSRGFDPGCRELLRIWGIGYKSS